VTLQIPEDMKAIMYQTWLPELMRTLLDEIKRLPQEQREALLTRMCTTCEDMAMAGALGIQPGMSWDDYVKYIREATPPIGPWRIEQDGNTYDLIYDATIGPDGKPLCHCPLLQLGMLNEHIPFCCDSGARIAAKMIGAATGKDIESSVVVDSPLRTGAAVCQYRVRVK
jgi:hypothetical protein